MSLVSVISTIVDVVDKVANSAPIETNLRDHLGSNVDILKTDGNIIKLLNSLSVNPLILTTAEARRSPAYKDTINASIDLFSGFYLQAFNVLTNVYGKDVNLAINVLNNGLNGPSSIGRENFLNDLFDISKECLISKEDNANISTSRPYNFKDQDSFHMEFRNLEIRINIANDRDKKEIVVPIIVKAMVVETTIENILNAANPYSQDKKFIARWREWRSGGITLSDFIFGTDLIKEYRKGKLKDEDDIIKMTNKRNVSSNAKLIKNGALGYEGNYAIIIAGSNDVNTINTFVKGDIFKERFKEEFLNNTQSLILNILDDDYERSIFMIDEIYSDTKVPYNKLNKGKKDGNDYTEIVKALMAGRSVGF